MTPLELVNTIIDGAQFSDEEQARARSMKEMLLSRGLTQKQLNYLKSTIDEDEAARAGWSPYPDELSYRIS